MRAIVYEEPRKYRLKEVPNPQPTDDEVIIKIEACGLCRTDLHLYEGEFIADFPLIPGHEFTGEIVEVGKNVKSLKVGQKVVADNTILCGKCYYCTVGKDLFCENFRSLGCNEPGGFAEYVKVFEEKVFPIHGLSPEEAIFTEPISCVIHGIDVIDPQPGDSALLFGAGPNGIILSQLLKYNGVTNLVVAAPTQFKLDIVRRLAADEVIIVNRNNYSEHEEIIQQKYPRGFDIVIDATGASTMAEHLIKFSKYGGKVIFYGVYPEKDRIYLSPYLVFRKELKIIGSFAQTHCFDRAVRYLENGIVKVKELVTHKFPLDEYGEALNLMEKEHSKCLKIAIKP